MDVLTIGAGPDGDLGAVEKRKKTHGRKSKR